MSKSNKPLAAPVVTESVAVVPAVGEVWQRPDGSQFTIENVGKDHAVYWLASGSKPQYRTIALANFKRYRRVLWAE